MAPSPKSIAIKISLLFLLITAACAPLSRSGRPRTPADSREPPVTSDLNEDTAQRRASNALIEEGRKAMDQGLYDRSSDLLQEAATVDASNGTVYYYLALVKIRTGEYGEASGFIEKAETLLPPDDPEWASKIQELKQDLR